ncbi:zinc ribbon domain-containing protein [Halobacterium sp. R2-5]|uniref:zinc ribbon domain-containing protein n=1 Tax=Halobacterium sp. R2-5 TaxID=2715751 RepID=UPI00141E0D04|nr:zinc ribbon domain-containing protein [Halobacterium sp. R2-5]NIB98600.1 zinc ribbon domain-containing protein [Halobacterium sp. R2-5]
MSKITFRADDDLVDAVDDREESKSEVMREALRTYLDGGGADEDAGGERVDDVIAERVDELVERRLAARARERDVNVNITVEPADGLRADVRSEQGAPRREPTGRGDGRPTDSGGRREQSCAQCGAALSDDHVYCPNCGEKATRRVFCECGDEVRADWSFCPHCGRRTASADALDR